jgi:hypothetical protein
MSAQAAGRPTIARIWRGRVRRERADEYEAYNYEVGIKPLIEKALGVQTFREDREHESEFMTISYWEDIPSMSRFRSDPHPSPRPRRGVFDRTAEIRANPATPREPRADGIA